MTGTIAGNTIGAVISIVFVVVVLIVAEIMGRKGNFSPEVTRKVVHIGVAHWWLIAMFFIEDMRFALVPPFIFVLLNYLSYKKDLIKSMEREEDISDLGTVYFPTSIIVLVFLTWDGGLLGADLKFLGALGILIMGYGDGFAAIIGRKYGKVKYSILGSIRTIEGSLTMFFLAFVLSTLILGITFGLGLQIIQISFILAVLAMLIEAFTPYGFDNLTVPIITTLVAYALIYCVGDHPLFTIIFMSTVGFLLSFIFAYAAYRKNSLSISGTVGAILLGTIIYVTAGLYGFAMMILFFLSSSLLSSFKKKDKEEVLKSSDKTGRRDILQVFANGGVGLIHAVLFYITSNPLFLIGLTISFAAANADTWATELGTLNKKDPISLRTFKPVSKGTSGAVSIFGTTSSLVGSMIIGLFATVGFALMPNIELSLGYIGVFLIVTFGGFIGAAIDSIFGATVQGIYYSDGLQRETERKEYNGKPNRLIRGFAFVNNDVVNFTSIAIASVILLGFL